MINKIQVPPPLAEKVFKKDVMALIREKGCSNVEILGKYIENNMSEDEVFELYSINKEMVLNIITNSIFNYKTRP